MAAPYHFCIGFAACFRMHQPNQFVERQVRPNHSHAAGVAYINCNGVGAFLGSAVLPLHQEFHSGNNAFVASESFPSIL